MKVIFIIVVLCFGTNIYAQEKTSKEQAEQLAQEFSKTKHLKKEKYGVVKEKSKSIVCTPVLHQHPEEYSGHYSADFYYQINLKVAGNVMEGSATIHGQNYQLNDIKIEDALFKATIRSGSKTEHLEGVFANRSNDGEVSYGLALKVSEPVKVTEGITTEKLFLQKKNNILK